MKVRLRLREMTRPAKSSAMGVRIPTEEQILENPDRRFFIAGGWVDSSNLCEICLYWHRRQEQFTLYSLLQVLEHEALHAVLANLLDLDTSMKLDNVYRSSCKWLSNDRIIFVNEFFVDKWVFPPYLEEPTY